jgi:hypothetical protein
LRKELRLRMFENRVLRRIFWSKRDEVIDKWKILHSEELSDLCCSPSIAQMIKLRMRWSVYVTYMGRGVVYTGIWWGNLRERDDLDDPGVNGRISVRWIFGK